MMHHEPREKVMHCGQGWKCDASCSKREKYSNLENLMDTACRKARATHGPFLGFSSRYIERKTLIKRQQQENN